MEWPTFVRLSASPSFSGCIHAYSTLGERSATAVADPRTVSACVHAYPVPNNPNIFVLKPGGEEDWCLTTRQDDRLLYLIAEECNPTLAEQRYLYSSLNARQLA